MQNNSYTPIFDLSNSYYDTLSNYEEKKETRYKVARPSKLFSKPKSRKLVSYSTKSSLNM